MFGKKAAVITKTDAEWRQLVQSYFTHLNSKTWWRRNLFPIKKVAVTAIGGSLTLSSYWLRRDGDFELDMMLGEYTVIKPAATVLEKFGRQEMFDWLTGRFDVDVKRGVYYL